MPLPKQMWTPLIHQTCQSIKYQTQKTDLFVPKHQQQQQHREQGIDTTKQKPENTISRDHFRIPKILSETPSLRDEKKTT